MEKRKSIIAIGWPFMSFREREEFVFQISNRHIEITENDIILLLSYNNTIYRIYMQYTDHSPLLNYSCLRAVVIQELDNYSNPALLHKKIECILKDVNSVYIVLYTLQIEALIKSFGNIDTYFKILTAFMSSPSCKKLLYSSSILEPFERNREFFRKTASYFPELYIDNLCNAENGAISKWIKSINQIHSTAIKQRVQVYKEELMAIAWHPKRVERWLEAGLDVDDM